MKSLKEMLISLAVGAIASTAAWVPLHGYLSHKTEVATAKKVQEAYQQLTACLGPDLFILGHASIEDIRRVSSSIFAEAINRMRSGKVIREAGYDGEYGVIRVFKEEELKKEKSAGLLFDMPPARSHPQAKEPTCSGRARSLLRF